MFGCSVTVVFFDCIHESIPELTVCCRVLRQWLRGIRKDKPQHKFMDNDKMEYFLKALPHTTDSNQIYVVLNLKLPGASSENQAFLQQILALPFMQLLCHLDPPEAEYRKRLTDARCWHEDHLDVLHGVHESAGPKAGNVIQRMEE